MNRDLKNFRRSLLRTAAAGALAFAALALPVGAPVGAYAANPPVATSVPPASPAASSDATTVATPAAAKPADNKPAADKKSGKSDANKVPEDVVKGLVAGTPEGMDKVKRFLFGDKMDSQAITERGIALVNAVRNTPAGQDPQKLLALSQKISETAKSIFQSSTITKVTIDRQFKPQAGDKAWKFGPRDASAPPGFEMVTPEDSRLRGTQNMRGIHRPGTDPMTSSGIIGVRNFESSLPNGEWRVIMITDDLGEPSTAKEPFGSQIQVNNTHVPMAAEDPTQWLERAYLTNKDINPAGKAPGADAAGGLGVSGGVVTHQDAADGSSPLPKGDVGSTTAGAVTMQTNVNEQHLGVGWAPPKTGGQETYIVGIIAEPASRPPSMTSSTAALDMEGKIFNQAVNLTQPPKAGQPVVQTGGPTAGPLPNPLAPTPRSNPNGPTPNPGPNSPTPTPVPPGNIPVVCGNCSPSNS